MMDPRPPSAAARSEAVQTEPTAPPAPPAAWQQERAKLLELLAQQQRIAQAGLLTAAIAHDVNNELQILSGIAWLAQDSGDPCEQHQALGQVRDRCVALSETMSSFLAFVRRRDDAALAKFRLSDVLSHTRNLAQPLARRHKVNVTYHVEEDSELHGELRVANQSVLNLVSNAIQACAEGGGEITVTASRPLPGTARLEVSDTGPGVPDSVRKLLFRPFATGRAGSGGTGLGLFIVRLAVRKMNGTIRMFTSARGTTFRIDIPTA